MSGPKITRIAIPANSQDANCHAVRDQIWDYSFGPILPGNVGIGHLIEPLPYAPAWRQGTDFVLHDHQYAGNQPTQARATIEIEFSDASAKVSELLVVQHGNGITEIDVSVGANFGALTPLGTSVSTVAGAKIGAGVFVDGQLDLFPIPRPTAGKVMKLYIRQTSLPSGFACYRIYPRDMDHDSFIGKHSVSIATVGSVAVI